MPQQRRWEEEEEEEEDRVEVFHYRRVRVAPNIETENESDTGEAVQFYSLLGGNSWTMLHGPDRGKNSVEGHVIGQESTPPCDPRGPKPKTPTVLNISQNMPRISVVGPAANVFLSRCPRSVSKRELHEYGKSYGKVNDGLCAALSLWTAPLSCHTTCPCFSQVIEVAICINPETKESLGVASIRFTVTMWPPSRRLSTDTPLPFCPRTTTLQRRQ